MAAFQNPLYSFPTVPFAETFWTSWNVDVSPISDQNDGNLKMDQCWQTPSYSMPDYSCLPFSSFAPTTNPIFLGQYSDNQLNTMNWMHPIHTFTSPMLPTNPSSLASPSTHDLIDQCGTFPDSSNISSGSTTPSDHSSPSDCGNSAPSPAPSAYPKTKLSRDAKAPIRCWEHSCGGRAFSSLGNYERHLREKSGRAKTFTCEQCGQRFTRSTAKHKHIRHGRCRARQSR
ncbi:hypothetical protein BDW74DRAFT_160439 [Aspergillus multicolor]|uniref:uncharacterized protein n=1 Tax=Aspergillus multicolor TaxID=41759 RepID=UPI003CCCA952